METSRFEEKLSHSAASTQQEQIVRNNDADQATDAPPALTTPPVRRSEARLDYRCLCSYEVLDVMEKESVVIERGTAFALDQSTEGLRLFMRRAPCVEQLIEVHSPPQKLSRSVNVFEVRWTRPVQVESFGNLYLVGCRRIFGLYDSVST